MGTYTHMAPEVIRGWYSPACDVWSCGIMLYYLLVGYNPFRGKTKEDTLENIVSKEVSFKGIAEFKQVRAGHRTPTTSKTSSSNSSIKTSQPDSPPGKP